LYEFDLNKRSIPRGFIYLTLRLYYYGLHFVLVSKITYWWTLGIFSDFCLQCWYFKYIWYILYIYYNCTRLIRTGGIYKCVLWVYCVIVDIIVQFRLEILSLRLLLCDMKDNILMNFMYIFVWILMFYLYLMHINHMSITFLSVRSWQEEYAYMIHKWGYCTV
jgi:hypothetical protein